MKDIFKRSILYVALVLSFVMLVACAKKDNVDDEGNEKSGREGSVYGKVIVSYGIKPFNLPAMVENDYSLFEDGLRKTGYDFKYYKSEDSKDVMDKLASGEINIGNAVEAEEVIIAASKGLDVKIVNVTSRYLKECSKERPSGMRLMVTTKDYYNKNKSLFFSIVNLQNNILKMIDEDTENAVLVASNTLEISEKEADEMRKDYDFTTTITDKDKEKLKKTEEVLFEQGIITKHVDINKLF